MRRRPSKVVPVAAGLFSVILAGCLTGSDAQGPSSAGLAGVFLVDGNEVKPAGDVPWVTGQAASSGTDVRLDWLDLLEPDRLSLILVQALGEERLEVDIDSERGLRYEPDPLAGEGRAASDFCIFEMQEQDAPGDAFVARAGGNDVAIPERAFADRNGSWFRFGGSGVLPTSYGVGGGSSLGGLLEPGRWLLFGAGTSGIPADQLMREDMAWELAVKADGPMRILVLPSALFLCGAGFSRFGGVAVPPGVAYQGGEREVQDKYGVTVAFESDAEVVTGAGLALRGSEGELRFGDEIVLLQDMSNVWRTSYQPLVGAIAIEQWVGNPTWMLVGASIAHPPELGLDGGN